jgi:two-component system sensor histidine kinase DesK
MTTLPDRTATAPRRPPDRQWQVFHGFMRWSFLLLMLLLPPCLIAVLDLPLPFGRTPMPRAALLVLALATIMGMWAVDAALRVWTSRALPQGRGAWGLPRVGVVRGGGIGALLVLVPLLASIPLAVGGPDGRRVLVVCLCIALVALSARVPWWWGLLGLLVVILVGAALGIPLPESAPAGGITLGFSAGLRSSLWLTGTVREIDELRTTQSELAVAEERLRFARDLHDVTGRDLSAIAVTAELAARLAERGDQRASQQAQDVARIARRSLAHTRALVRGYREADLATELRGTVSLLRAAGITVEVGGSTEDLPSAWRDRAAWVLREAGTNVLRHADPEHVEISLAPHTITVRNDGLRRPVSPSPAGDAVCDRSDSSDAQVPGVSGSVAFGSGLTGVAERVAPRGTVQAGVEGDRFVLRVDLGSPSPDRADPETEEP